MPNPIKHTFSTAPVTPTAPKKGRKPKPVMPPLPKFEMSPFEQEWFDYFQEAALETFPDLTDFERISLLLASIEFIKYLRVAGQELATGEVISQARQHPGTQLNALLDRLAATRKERLKQPKEDDDPNADLLRAFAS